MVIKYPGQSMQEACLHAEQFICAYDGDVYGKREAKKLARRDAREYIRQSKVGQPRLVKTPVNPLLSTAPEGAIRSRDKRLGFYFVLPDNTAEMMINPPQYGYDRDALGDDEARQCAAHELARKEASNPSARLHIDTTDFLPTFYRPVVSTDGVYELDPEAAEPFLARNRQHLDDLDPEMLAEMDRLFGSD